MLMLEDHVVPFTRKWTFPLGFFGQQGEESIHHDFVSLAETFSRVKPATDRLKKMLEEHFIVTSPSNREIVPTKSHQETLGGNIKIRKKQSKCIIFIIKLI